MIGRTAHSVRLLLRIGEMTVPSILGRRGCAPVIGPSDEGPKCRVCRAPIAIRRVSVCRVRAARQRRVRVLGLLATALGEHARGFTPPYIENLPQLGPGGACVGPRGGVCRALVVTSGSPCEYHLAQDNLDAIQAQLNSYEELVRLRDSPDKRPPLRTCQRRHNRASPISPTKQNKRDHAHPLHHMK
jgi:hypothetical protein